MSKRTLLALLLLLTAVEVCLADQPKYDIVKVVLITQQGRFSIKAEVADSNTKRTRGLMHRSRLAPDAGMLFVFKDEAVRSFWMKKTLIPLDIIFISNDLAIRHIAMNATPCEDSPCEKYSSVYPVKYAVEINGGLSKKMGLRHGDYIELDLSALTGH